LVGCLRTTDPLFRSLFSFQRTPRKSRRDLSQERQLLLSRNYINASVYIIVDKLFGADVTYRENAFASAKVGFKSTE